MPGEPLGAPEDLPKEGPGQVTLGWVLNSFEPRLKIIDRAFEDSMGRAL
jgi:hypothetical protein